ncbi:hypothetical protein ACOESC_001010 [Salmonella enterica]
MVHENKYVNKKECRVGERPREGWGFAYSLSKKAGLQHLFNEVKNGAETAGIGANEAC